MVGKSGYSENLQRWMDYFHGEHDPKALSAILHEDVVFTSPVVHTPQKGKAITMLYLGAAGQTMGGDTFRYTRVFDCGDKAVLEFECEMDGVLVNGVDLIEWDDKGLIKDFKVMVRPLKGMQAVHAAMGRMLEQMKAAHS
ncbi:MAG: nuclear transport factor 2 family protein [Henriciella sp.]|uniref:nuclear transport factor 2 family protein n=1 Tax=Henriciella sp. TaxID=1968823 RepID=UPI003C7150F8